ncbi:putative membrane protein [Candidatus Erwinia dacicola]|uniref:Membrane protein n=1 Tax=Candidatus Erwinia dacicola TaxID=252393 RepID=A0A328TKG7_9GAMM|nr:putative membrane protein [Candidatus Erwinia dacicola]
MLEGELFLPYLPVLAPAFIGVVILAGKVFFSWSLSPLHEAAG